MKNLNTAEMAVPKKTPKLSEVERKDSAKARVFPVGRSRGAVAMVTVPKKPFVREKIKYTGTMNKTD